MTVVQWGHHRRLQRIPSCSGSHSHFELGTTYKLHMWWVQAPTRPLAIISYPPFRASTSVIIESH